MTDSKKKITRSARNDAVKAEKYDAMRAKMSFAKAIKSINDIEQIIEEVIKPGSRKKLSTQKMAAMSILLDSKWKRINKLLPNLKAVELSGNVGIRNIVRIVNLTGEEVADDEDV